MPRNGLNPRSSRRPWQKSGEAISASRDGQTSGGGERGQRRMACEVFVISETCYRYQPKLSEENADIADWLIRLTHNQRNWGFGLGFLYLRNVKGFG